MREKTLDSMGLPVKERGKQSPVLSARLRPEQWQKVRHLKTLWEAERKINLSISDVVGALIHQAYEAVLNTPMKPAEKEGIPCVNCAFMPAGDVYSCRECGRQVGANLDTMSAFEKGGLAKLMDVFPVDPPAVKPAPVRKAKKKTKGVSRGMD